MSAVLTRARTDLRGRWRAWLGLALVIGLAGGGVTGLAAGARRTATAYERMLVRSAPSDLLVLDTSALNSAGRIDLDAAARMPGVETAARVTGLFSFAGEVDGVPLPAFAVVPYSGPAGELGSGVERSLLVEGRRADPTRVDEMVVSFEAARRFDIGPGSTVNLEMMDEDRLLGAAAAFLPGLVDRLAGRDRSVFELAAEGGARTYRFTVVGVTSSPMDFPPVPATLQPVVYPTPAFHEAVGRRLVGGDVLIVRLEPGTSAEDYKAALEAANEGRGITYAGGGVERFASTQRSIDLQAQALWMLAALVALAGALITSQLLARQAELESGDHETLTALGMTRRQLRAVGMIRVGLIAAGAAAVTVLVAVAVSPAFPIGTAAGAEPAPGLRVDLGIVAVGALLTGGLCLVAAIVAERLRRGRTGQEPRRRAWAPLSHLPLTLHLGSRLALAPGRGRTAVPVRSTLAALTVAVAAAALSVTFVASLGHLVDTPRLYGWDWDLQLGGVGVPDISEQLVEGLGANPAVGGMAIGAVAQLEVDGRRVDGYALDPVQGTVSAALLEGRAPIAADEIVLGSVTLDDLGASIGDEVEVGRGGTTVLMEVVGRSVFPNLGDAGQLGRGARVTFTGLEQIAPGTLRTVALVDFVPSADLEVEVISLRRALDVYPVLEDQPPDDLVNFGDASAFPIIVGATLALVTAATLLHTLVSSIRRRRADLAVLKTIGLSRGQVSRTVAAQATVLAGAALLVGLPLGVAGGRTAWTLVAGQIGFPAEPALPVGALATLAITVLVFANVVAWGPAWVAGRTPPARILRTE